jgi:anti-sigma factor RsiW
MDCRDARASLLDDQRGRLDAGTQRQLSAHLESCADCRHEDAAERLLGEALEHRLPQRPASAALRERVGRVMTARPRRWWRWRGALVPALAVALALFVTVPALLYERSASTRGAEMAAMVGEAVADHLRIVQAQRPIEIESGGVHEVRPWFEGRLDFSPVVPFAGDATMPLRGGALAYFRDRKAAAFVYGLRRHTVTLLVFRPEGLPWPRTGLERIGRLDAHRARTRGFTVILWQANGLGYALVSDADPHELVEIAARFSSGV